MGVNARKATGFIMALYKHGNYLTQINDTAFDVEHKPGQSTPHSGIYRCMGCGREIVSEGGKVFPPQNHHQHTATQGTIRWKMIVYADHQPK
jgi:hypothetical protein